MRPLFVLSTLVAVYAFFSLPQNSQKMVIVSFRAATSHRLFCTRPVALEMKPPAMAPTLVFFCGAEVADSAGTTILAYGILNCDSVIPSNGKYVKSTHVNAKGANIPPTPGLKID